MKKKLATILSALIFVPGLLQAIYGFDRVYNSLTGTTVDLIYDDHAVQEKICSCRLQKDTAGAIEKRLRLREQRFMKALRKLNDERPSSGVLLVWEQGLYTHTGTEFIAHSKKLIKDQFPYLKYVASDISRDAFEHNIKRFGTYKTPHASRRFFSCSLEEPLPFPKERQDSIKRIYGDLVFIRYQELYARTIRRLKRYFAGRRRISYTDFQHNNPFDAVADAEMLSHILAAAEKHVIVFAGGWHSHNIYTFLCSKAGFKSIRRCHPINTQTCISLDIIAQKHEPKITKKLPGRSRGA